MSEVKVNKITPTAACGTVTLGDSGDTFTLPSGVTLSSAGSITNSGTITNTGTISGGTITGTIDNQVNWDTTAKTAGFTAVAGNGYFVNTTSGAITVTLPATPTAGDLVGIKDYANTADTNNITIDRNGSNIQGTANNFVISTEGLAITLIYVDGTQGWLSTGAAQANNITSPTFIVATGGTIHTCGDYKTHVFTGPGTFTVSSVGNPAGSNSVEYLVVAGGGGGGKTASGGGGAGGVRQNYPSPTTAGLPVTATGYPITVGAGGVGTCSTPGNGGPGSNTVFSTITSAGGGGGASGSGPGAGGTAQPGGSGGGGAGGTSNSGPAPGGVGNTPPVSPPQGFPGGTTNVPAGPPIYGGSGGGGAGAAGSAGSTTVSGNGGDGIPMSPLFFSGAAPSYGTTGPAPGRYFGGGGGGSGDNANPGAFGGAGGGGRGGIYYVQAPGCGVVNTGGGSGGADFSCTGRNAGSGIVIIRYKYQ